MLLKTILWELAKQFIINNWNLKSKYNSYTKKSNIFTLNYEYDYRQSKLFIQNVKDY